MYKKCKKYARQKILDLIELRLRTYTKEIYQEINKIERENSLAKKREEELNAELAACRQKIDRLYAIQTKTTGGYYDIDIMDEPAVRKCMTESKGNAWDAGKKQLGAVFEKEIEKKIALKKANSLVIVCCGFRKLGKYEAIRAEAYQIFLLLKRSTDYDVRLLSVESGQEDVEEDAGIVYASEEKLEAYFASRNIRLVIALEATAHIMFLANGLFFKYPALIRLSAQNPLEGVSKQAQEALLHLNDLGMQHYMVFSQYAQNVMKDAGFKNVRLSYPVMNPNKLCAAAYEKKQKKKLTIGFASSPMDERQMEDRGVYLLCDWMEQEQEAEFLRVLSETLE